MELQTPRSCTGAAASRLKGFAIDNGVMMTGILAFSQTFRRLIVNMDAESWTLMNRMIKVNGLYRCTFLNGRLECCVWRAQLRDQILRCRFIEINRERRCRLTALEDDSLAGLDDGRLDLGW